VISFPRMIAWDTGDNAVLARAQTETKKWISALRLDGKHDLDRCVEALSGRTFKGKPVKASCYRSPGEIPDGLIDKLAGQLKDQIGIQLRFHLGGQLMDQLKDQIGIQLWNQLWNQLRDHLWDYYAFAFYESAMRAAGLSHEFTDQSLLPAFEAGVGFVIVTGPQIVGICLPEIHLDENGKIHRDGGPAIVWGDNEQWWRHGERIEDRKCPLSET